VSLLATIAVSVPLAYQARSARDAAVGGPTTTTVASTVPTSTAAPATTTTTIPTQVLPTTIERTDQHLSWASAEAPQDVRPLEGATLRGEVVVQIQLPPATTPVVKAEFWIDPATATGPANVDERPPFTLGAEDHPEPTTFDTTTLPDGLHTVAVKALQADGATVEQSSEFRVDNG
jgi:hypothetical protein